MRDGNFIGLFVFSYKLLKTGSGSLSKGSWKSHELFILGGLVEDILDILPHLKIIDHLVTLIQNEKS